MGNGAQLGTYLAMCCGQWKAEVRAGDDDDGGSEFDGETAGGGDLGELDTDGLDDGVAIGAEADDDAGAADDEDPCGELGLLDQVLLAVDMHDGGKGADGVGDVVGAVRKGIAARGEDLEVPEDALGSLIKDLGVVMDLLHCEVLLDGRVGVVRVDGIREASEEGAGLVCMTKTLSHSNSH